MVSAERPWKGDTARCGSQLDVCSQRRRVSQLEGKGLRAGQAIQGFLQDGTENEKCQNREDIMWESMLHCCSRKCVEFFKELAREGEFDKDMLEDQIALYAVCEDRLRTEIFDFVETWNLHKIRLQRNRPHVVHGMPWYNYHYPDPQAARNWDISIDRSDLDDIAAPVADIELGTCLSPETKEWRTRAQCSQLVKSKTSHASQSTLVLVKSSQVD